MRRWILRAAGVALLFAASTGCEREEEGPFVRVYTRDGSAGVFRVTVADGPPAWPSALDAEIAEDESVLLRHAREGMHALPAVEVSPTIDVLYVNAMQTIVDLQGGLPAGEPPPPRAPWVMALVLPGGFVEKSGVMIGEKIDPRNVPPPPTSP